ncbi:MAG: hypothetical protein PHE20_02145 [Patescibacteria group bacterium]|nr:hypothetical protein [Patescibacteria group bacterium]
MHKKVIHWWHGRRARFYRNSRWHLVLDISLVVLIILLASIALRLSSYHPQIMNTLNFDHYFNGGTSTTTSNDKLKFEVGSQINKNVISNGDDIILTINYANLGNVDLDTLTITPEFSSAAFKIIELSLVGNDSINTSIKDNALILKELKVDEGSEISLLIKWSAVKTDFPREINWSLHVEGVHGQQEAQKNQILPSIKIISDLNLEANIYFHSPQGDQLGIGPIPPIVGIPTTYWLIVKAENLGNDLSDLVFSANLPTGVELSGEESLLAGKASYDKAQRRLIWQLDSLSAVGGDYIANFGLNFTPTDEQVGKNAIILSNLRYNVTDNFTGTRISGSLNNLDSSLPDDHLNRGLGVIEAE